MNISLLHYSSPPVVGGVESVLSHHARLMADAGYHVQILAGRGGQTDPRIPFIQISLLDSRNPQVQTIKSELDRGVVSDKFSELKSEISAVLSKALVGVDILIAHNVCSLHKNLPLTAALFNLYTQPGAPRLILWHHDLAWSAPRYHAELHEGYPWDLLRSRWPGASQVVVSELRCQELSDLTGIPKEQIAVIPNGIDLARFLKLDAETIRLVQQLSLYTANPLILLPVRITPRKNIELALHTLASLRRCLPNAALVITGPLGPHNPANTEYFDRLSKLRAELDLAGMAHFLAECVKGYLPDEVVFDFYRLADALFLPSREEGFGIPLLEAGLTGLPIFCTDIPPLVKLGGDQAFYFSPDADPDQVASLIYSHFSASITYQMRRRVREHFIWEQIYTRQIAPLLETGESFS